MVNTSQGRYAHLDAMRAVAVSLVVVAHAGLGHIVPGGSGVTIFFAISGFIITHLVLREMELTARFAVGPFYQRRLLKLGPPLIVIIAIPTLIYAAFNEINWAAFAGQLIFFFNWQYIDHIGPFLPGSAVVWSLSIEEQFYIVFAILWIGIIKLSRDKVTALAVIASLVIFVSTSLRFYYHFLGDGSSTYIEDRIYYGTDTRLDSIAWGVLCATILWRWNKEKTHRNSGRLKQIVESDAAALFAVVAFLISLGIRDEWFRDTLRFTIQTLAACIIILYGFGSKSTALRKAFQRASGWNLVRVIGLSSYSIYLVHLILANVFRSQLRQWPLPIEVLVNTVAGFAVGIALYYVVERPFEGFRKKLRGSKPAKASAESATRLENS